jgi:magnesium transporter
VVRNHLLCAAAAIHRSGIPSPMEAPMTGTESTDRPGTTIHDLIRSDDTEALRAMLASHHSADIVALLDGVDAKEAAGLIRLLPEERQGRVFGYFAPEQQVAMARALDRGSLAELITRMSHDERADLFNRLTPEQQAAILPGLAQAEREDIRKLAAYPEGTAGSVMTSDYATLSPELTTREAVDKLRLEAPDKETIYEAYIVDHERRVVGRISLRDLLVAPDQATVGAVMRRDVHVVRAEEDREVAAQAVGTYDLIAVPVIDGDDRLVGIITHDDAMDVQVQEATIDMHKVASVGEGIVSVRNAGIWLLYRMRFVWLVLLVFGNIFSGAGIAYFEDTIAAYVALVFFLPLLIDSGGNAGSQAATLMVRGLATGDVALRDWGAMIGREVLVAGLLGLSMALAVSVIGLWRGGPEIALVVSLSMILIVIVGSTIGMTLPFVLSRLKVDPATASAPLVTSIADAAGVLIYFAIATAFLPMPGA